MNKGTHFFGQPVYGQLIKCLEKDKIIEMSRNHAAGNYCPYLSAQMADRVAFQADKAEFSSQILLWREQQCYQNSDLGYIDSKSANNAAAAKFETQVEFFRIGYHGENCTHILYQSVFIP